MKKFHITFITFITIIISLMVLFFTTPIKSQDKAIENLRKTSKAFSSVARNVSPSVVFIQVEGTKLRSSYHQFPMPFDDKWPFRDDLFERFLANVLMVFHNRIHLVVNLK